METIGAEGNKSAVRSQQSAEEKVISYRLKVDKMNVTGYRMRVTGYGLQDTGYEIFLKFFLSLLPAGRHGVTRHSSPHKT